MNSSTSSTPSRSSALAWRIGAVILCVAGALAAALLWRQAPSPPPVAVPASAPKDAELTTEQILASIPSPDGDSLTDKALAAALAKVREKPATAVAWVNLGDSLAQVLRDTANAQYYDLAETAYKRALKLNPKSVDAMSGMAWVTGGQHLFDQSIA
ncbi:MAG: tetratricopeptide repeat protein [Verrucomicrobiota bacterium]|nr:tetratricopeptide repeat protein [Verrucomicrobiota bacterium]